MTDMNEWRRPIMRLVTAVMDDRIQGNPTLGQIADDLLAQIEPLIRADEREKIAQTLESRQGLDNAAWFVRHYGSRAGSADE